MIAHVNVNGDKYEVKLTDDTTGEVIEKLDLQETYEDWKQSAESSGTTVIEYNNAPPVKRVHSGEMSAQSAQSSPLPSIQENKEDPTQIEEYKNTLSEAKRLYAVSPEFHHLQIQGSKIWILAQYSNGGQQRR